MKSFIEKILSSMSKRDKTIGFFLKKLKTAKINGTQWHGIVVPRHIMAHRFVSFIYLIPIHTALPQ